MAFDQQTIEVRDGLVAIRTELNAAYWERADLVLALCLALLSQEHAYILGTPGTAKSDIVREFMSRFEGAQTFEALLSKQRPDAAILGPYNLPELRDKGDFRRKTTGFLPTADLAFLDEIGKMSPTLGHDLLAITNERIYHEVNGGRSAQKAPLSSMFAASNELIVDESDDAAALWDRLMVRIQVEPIQDTGNFLALLKSGSTDLPRIEKRTSIPWNEVRTVVETIVPTITVPNAVLETVMNLRRNLREDMAITHSDRRWRKGIRLIQAAAFLRGNDTADEDDVSALQFALWESPEQIPGVKRQVLKISNPHNEKLMDLLDRINEIGNGVVERIGQASEARAHYGAEANGKLGRIKNDIQTLEQAALRDGRSTDIFREVKERFVDVKSQVYVNCLGMDESTVAQTNTVKAIFG